MAGIRWARGTFQTFTSYMKIRAGGANSFDIIAGDTFEFDGTIVKYSGMEVAAPHFRGAYEQGWYGTEPLDESGQVAPRVTSRNVAKATSVNRDLANVQRGGSRAISSDSFDEDTVLSVSDRTAARHGESGHLTAKDHHKYRDQNGLSVNSDEVTLQDGRTVGRVKVAAKLKADVTTSGGAGLAEKLDNTPRGFGKNVRSALPNLIHTEGVTIKTNLGGVDRTAFVGSDEQEGTVVAKVRQTDKPRNSGDIEVKDTSNIRSVKAAKPISSKPLPIKVKIARRIDPGFPESWVFTGKLADRLAAAKKHGPTSEFVQALYAAEDPPMRRILEKDKDFSQYL